MADMSNTMSFTWEICLNDVTLLLLVAKLVVKKLCKNLKN